MRQELKNLIEAKTGLTNYEPYKPTKKTPKPYTVLKMGNEENLGARRFADAIFFEVHVAVDSIASDVDELDIIIDQVSSLHGSMFGSTKIERIRVVGPEFLDGDLEILTRQVAFRAIKINLGGA
jgi:hypothetical protein